MTVKELRIELEQLEKQGFENHQIFHDVCYVCNGPVSNVIVEENPSKVILAAGCNDND